MKHTEESRAKIAARIAEVKAALGVNYADHKGWGSGTADDVRVSVGEGRGSDWRREPSGLIDVYVHGVDDEHFQSAVRGRHFKETKPGALDIAKIKAHIQHVTGLLRGRQQREDAHSALLDDAKRKLGAQTVHTVRDDGSVTIYLTASTADALVPVVELARKLGVLG